MRSVPINKEEEAERGDLLGSPEKKKKVNNLLERERERECITPRVQERGWGVILEI